MCIVTAAIVGGGAAIAGGAIASRGAGKAAKTQSDAALESAKLQKQAQDEALAFAKQQNEEAKQRQAPWLASGTDALAKLSDLKSFQAPGADFTADPGYQFRLQEGNKAIERSAAARGRVLNPATQKALGRFGQDTASQEYGNVYGRRFAEYMNNLNQLQSRAGIGQTAVAGLNASGQQTVGNVANILGTGAARQGASIVDAGTARASGYAGSANAWSGAMGSEAENFNQTLLLSQLLKQQKQPLYYGGWTGQNPMDLQLP